MTEVVEIEQFFSERFRSLISKHSIYKMVTAVSKYRGEKVQWLKRSGVEVG